MTSPKTSRDDGPQLTASNLRLLFVVVLLCLVGLGIVAAKRLGYWPGSVVTVETVSAQSEPLDLNRAEWWELSTLPGIGEKRARAIVEYRQTSGPFRKVDELGNVPGISPKLIDGFRSRVQVTD